ncbi:hypothetical protein CAEBREN_26136 [Caenorhabditis brenneri]|uniref:WH1 domain-containing protein n=1 Tax=Caenorhabditis brenneri TaxID=135651 RepID=G0PFQ0_CAEBE|nr:hypothetical protein CAEBREN_26136 [Caenorhabditis brenneri]
MFYNNNTKSWETPPGLEKVPTLVQVLQDHRRSTYRIISSRPHDQQIFLNFYIFQSLRYSAATEIFHQWKDEQKQVYGLNFQQIDDARRFEHVVKQAIDQLAFAANDYQMHANDNVYQDPHQHMHHIRSAPTFHENNNGANLRGKEGGVYIIKRIHFYFYSNWKIMTVAVADCIQQYERYYRFLNEYHTLKYSKFLIFSRNAPHTSTLSSASAQAQQQRRASQSSNASAGTSVAPAPPTSSIPQAPPPPTGGIAPVNSSGAPPPPPLPPVGVGAPPPPPPPPPPAVLMASNGTPSLADQLKMKSLQGLKPTSNGVKTNGNVEPEKPAAAPKGDLMSELNAQLNKRKMTQAKSDAVDSKSNTSNGSSDSGCGIGTSGSNGGSVGSATAKKWSVSEMSKPLDSPKTHRKLPSASSLFAQDDASTTSSKASTSLSNGTTSTVVGSPSTAAVTTEQLERHCADMMVEVRLEMNKLRQDIAQMLEDNKRETIEAVLNAIGRR